MSLINYANSKNAQRKEEMEEEIFQYVQDERILRVLFEQKIFALRHIQKELNYFFKKVECWSCSSFFHRVIITKYHGIVCKKCYQALHEEASKTFFYFISALGIEFDTPLDEETKTLEDTIETMHNYWKTYIVEPDYDVVQFEKCYLKEMKAVKENYEMIEINGVDART